MWKEKFRTGIDNIDAQHKELFDKTGVLLRGANECVESNRDICISTILFLKGYAINHFSDEEKYLKSVNYPDIDDHIAQHKKFIQSVLDYERRMIETDFSPKVVKEFSGMLATWLIYHVADSDLKYAVNAQKAAQTAGTAAAHNHADMIWNSVVSTLNMMAGLEEQVFSTAGLSDMDCEGAIPVEVELVGGVSGYVTFVYSVPFIKNLVYALMNYTPDHVGDMEISALFELTNIMSGNICGQISKSINNFCDIKPPSLSEMDITEPDEQVFLNTGIGVIETNLVIEYPAA